MKFCFFFGHWNVPGSTGIRTEKRTAELNIRNRSARGLNIIAKKTWLIIALIVVLLILSTMIVSINYKTSEDVRKQAVTEVYDVVYSDDEGNVLIYYVCVTTYYQANSNDQTGLNTDTIAAVINPADAESCRECVVSNLPAAIYKKDGRAYLCWTIIPELSCVIEYDPTIENEADIFRMAESVPANAGRCVDP